MSRQGRSKAYLRRLLVAHLADQNDVRVCRSASEHSRKRQLDLLVDLHLVDAGQPVFDRILDRDDLHVDALSSDRAAYSVVVLPLPVGP